MTSSNGETVQRPSQKISETGVLTAAELASISAGNIFGDIARFSVREIKKP